MAGNQPNSLLKDELSNLRILLVEDNLVNQKVILKQLDSLGYAADIAVDGQEAIDAIVQVDYDVVLMDCQMPVLDGYSATRAIRQMKPCLQGQHRRPIVIAVTANTISYDRERAIASGMDDYLRKPVSREMLAKTLAHWGQMLLDTPISTSLPDAAEPVAKTTSDLLSSQIDWEHLHHISDGSTEFAMELLHLFTEDSYTQVAILRQAIATEEFRAIEEASHHIKGASANVGAILMQKAASLLEEQARQKRLNSADQLLLQLERSLDQIQAAITGAI